ncbi:MAG: hypothetical protein R2755_04185 [Acidimicrobiales bacterium]
MAYGGAPTPPAGWPSDLDGAPPGGVRLPRSPRPGWRPPFAVVTALGTADPGAPGAPGGGLPGEVTLHGAATATAARARRGGNWRPADLGGGRRAGGALPNGRSPGP